MKKSGINTFDKALNYIDKLGFPYSEADSKSNVPVRNIQKLDAEGSPFVWEDSGEPYAIVNFKMTTAELRNEALGRLAELAKNIGPDTESDDWVDKEVGIGNANLSMRADYDLAEELSSCGRATVFLDFVKAKDSDEEVLRIVEARPIKAEKHQASGTTVQDLRAMLLAKAGITE